MASARLEDLASRLPSHLALDTSLQPPRTPGESPPTAAIGAADEPAAAGAAGQRRFTVRSVLGSGASGTVLLVRASEDAARNYAMKIVSLPHPPCTEGDAMRLENVHDEIRCWGLCTSPFVARLEASFHEDTHTTAEGTLAETDVASPPPQPVGLPHVTRSYALVIELVECLDLRKELKQRRAINRPLRHEEAAALFAQILLALQHLHERRIVHRDVKTGNILLKQNGIVKLGDFGYAKLMAPGGLDTYVGTPYYVAPELWRREPYDERIDIYALGVVLYEMLTLQRPFTGATIEEVRQSALNGAYPPAGVHDDLIAHMLHGDYRRRPTAPQLLVTPELQRILRGLRTAIERSAAIVDADKVAMVGAVGRWIVPQPQPLPALATSDAVVVHEGGVLKKCSDGTFKPRFLRIARTQSGDTELQLSYNRESCSRKERRVATRTSLFTSVAALSPVAADGVAFAFRVQSREFQPMIFASGTDEERRRWVEELQSVMPRSSGSDKTGSGSGSSHATSTATTTTTIASIQT